MKPAAFEYHAPRSLDEALALLAEHGDAKVLAGGQSLVPMMNFRLVTPSIIVDLNRTVGLDGIEELEQGLALGAMVRQSRLESDPIIARRAPLLAEAMPFVAHPQIRYRGTLGGSLAHADPAAELPAVAIALEAQLKLASQAGERTVPAAGFFTGLFTTALEPAELLVQVILPPLPPRAGWSFQEVSRRHGDYALAGVAAVVGLDAVGRCSHARIVFLGLGPSPIAASGAAGLLVGVEPTAEAIASVAREIDAEIDPGTDIHASADFRRHLAGVLTRRALEQAVARAKSA